MSLTVPLVALDGATSTITLPDPVVTSGTGILVQVGQTTLGPTADNGNASLLLAQPISLTQAASLQSLSFYVRVVGGQLRLGLYSGTTSPTSLVSQSNAFTAVLGWNTAVATSASLAAGKYWLAYLPQSNTLGFWVLNQGGPSYYHTQAFGALPATFPSGPSSVAALWSFYGTFSTGPDTTPPTVPTGLAAHATGTTTDTLTWTTSTDNVGVTGYKVFRGGVQVGSVATTTFNDTGLTNNAAYTYAVSAFDAAGNNSGQSAALNYTQVWSNAPIGIGISSVSVGAPPNANKVVGVVSVTTANGQPYPGTLILGGTDAAKFALTNGGLLPCNLVVGPTDIPLGTYSINLTAN
jgi:chitodextrinase